MMVASGGPEKMKAYREDVRCRVAANGRDPDDVKVLFIASPVLVDDGIEAAAYVRARTEAMSDEAVGVGLAGLAAITGIDFARYPLDEPLPDDVTTNGNQSQLASLRDGRTVREIGFGWMGLDPQRPALVGTPDVIADEMAAQMDVVGGDGYLITGPLVPERVVAVVDRLVPALRARGLVRTEYSSTLLRDNLVAF